MRSIKKFTKLTAGILSLSLVCGAAGYLPQNSSVLSSARAESYYVDEFPDYELKDVYIMDCRESKDSFGKCFYFSAIPKIDGVYSTWWSNKILRFRINLDEPNENPIAQDLYERNNRWLGEISNGTIITMKFNCYKEYQDLRTVEKQNFEGFSSRDEYEINEIYYVKSPSVHFYGDINDDGVVDSFDLIAYRKCLAGNTDDLTNDMFLNGDINKNEEIDADDLERVTEYLLGETATFYGNADIGSVRLDNTVDVKAEEGTVTDEAFAKAEMQFGVELLKNSFAPSENGEKNLLISPLSISSALAMTANGADGNTRKEMEKVLGNGLTLDEINEYMAYYAANLPDEQKEKLYLANSIWLKNDPAFEVHKEFLEANKKYYDSEIYKTNFDESTLNDVNGWVDKNTKGMIPMLFGPNEFNAKKNDLLMMLINTLYFEAEWAVPYKSTKDGKFTDLDGKEHNIKRMESQEYMYYDLGDADAFKKPYANGDYSFVGILPKEKDITEYISGLDGEKLVEGLKECEDPDNVELHVMIPKFKYGYSKSLKDVLKDMGMGEAFDDGAADFSGITDSINGNLYIDDVLHKTKIEVTEKGTKAAAVTVIMMMGNAAPVEKKKVYIELDKPFVYMIVDKNNVPVFIGAATQISEN